MHSGRHDDILRLLQAKKSVTVAELKAGLGLSEVTIRKDLAKLEELGHVVRTWGGAILAQDSSSLRPLKQRSAEGTEAKSSIAAAAAELVRDNEAIFLDSGTTVAALAAGLAGRALKVLTNSLPVMIALADAESISLFSIGGMFRHGAGSFVGPQAVAELRTFSVDTAFLGTSGFDSSGLCSAQNTFEADLKRAVLGIARRRVLLCDATKFGRSGFSVFARPSEIDLLITDASISREQEIFIRGLGIELLVAGRDAN